MPQITKKTVHTFLSQNRLAVISTVNSKNTPDAAPIYYLVDEDFNFYFITPVKTQKHRNITKNHNIVLTITNEEASETVEVKGLATESQTPLPEVLQKLAVKLNQDLQFFTTLPLLRYKDQKKVVIKIKPKSIHYRKYLKASIQELKF